MSLVICVGGINIYNGRVGGWERREWCGGYKGVVGGGVLLGRGWEVVYSLSCERSVGFGRCRYVKKGLGY